MNNFFYFIILLLFLSCSNHNEKSFIFLSEAFSSWNQKYNSRYTFTYLNDFNSLSHEYSLEQVNSDLRRFDMEISRIEKKKLSESQLFYHNILENYLNNLIYDFDVLKHSTWNLIETLSQFRERLLLLHALSESNENYKDVVNNELNIISDNIFDVINNMIYFDKNQKKYSLDILDEIDIISNNFIAENNQFFKALDVLRDWLIDDYSRLSQLSFKELGYDLDKNARHRFGANYSVENIREIAEKQIQLIQIEMFNLSLTNYLGYNDEPIWLDFGDTLNVIEWSLNSLGEEVVSKDKILSTSYKIYNELIESFSKNNISISKKTKNILFAPLFVENLKYSQFLYVPYKKIGNHDSRVKCFINTYSRYQNNSRNYFDIHLDIIESIMYSDIYFLQDNLSLNDIISQAYNHDLFIYGWKNYSQLYYLEKILETSNYTNLKLAYLKNKLNNVLRTIACIDYYENNFSLQKIKSDMRKFSFLNDLEIENNIYLILSKGSKVMREFIGFNELVNLSYRYNNSDISDDFINKIIDNKVFSLDMIKEKLFE